MHRVARVFALSSTGTNQFMLSFITMWATHVIVGGFALARQSWARKVTLVLSVAFAAVAAGRIFSNIFSEHVWTYAFVLVVYCFIYYCFVRQDVRELYHKAERIQSAQV